MLRLVQIRSSAKGSHRSLRLFVSLEALESRELCTATPNDYEQLMLALINRARANPVAEGQRLLALAQSDPVLHKATQGWDLNTFYQTISSYGPLPPLAFDPRLIDAALAEDANMVAINGQVHSPSGFLTNPSVATASDGKAYFDVTNASWATGENIFAYSANVIANSPADYINYFEAAFLIDWGNPDYGHLKNLLAPGPSTATSTNFPYSVIGIGMLTNVQPTVPPDPNPPNPANAGLNVGPAVIAEEFGWRSTSNPFLTGIVYNDQTHAGIYAPGEGYGGVTIKAVGLNGQGIFQTSTWSSGGYSLALPPGAYSVTASGGTLSGQLSTTVTIGVDNVEWDAVTYPNASKADIPLAGNFNGTTKTDFAVFSPDSAQWTIQNASTGATTTKQFGWGGVDVPVPGKYDGGSKTEIAVYRPTTAQWFISGPTGTRVIQFGWAGNDIPEPADYDGDGITDIAVYRPSTAQWFIRDSTTGKTVVKQFGWAGVDQPVPADYTGDGKADIAVYRPTTAQWFVLNPITGKTQATQFGWAGVDVPVVADYDGDGKADIAVFRPTTDTWYVRQSSNNQTTTKQFGWAGVDQPIPGDFDGDGKADIGVFRPTTGQFFLNRTTAGLGVYSLGKSGTTQTLASLLASHNVMPSAWLSWTPPSGSPAAKTESGTNSSRVRKHKPVVRRVVPQAVDVLLQKKARSRHH